MREAFQYQRIVWLHNRMKVGSVGREEYVDLFGVSDRTFLRDMAWLGERFNAPVVHLNGKYTYSDPTFDLPQMAVTREELVGLYAAIPLVEEFRGTPVYKTLKRMVGAVKAGSSPGKPGLESSIFRLNKKEITLDWEMFSVIAQGIEEKRTLVMNYYSLSSSSVTSRKIDPYHVYVYENEFYLAGCCHVRKEVRDFNLNRVKFVTLTDVTYEIPESFSLDSYLGSQRWGIMKSGEVISIVVKIRKEKVYEVTEDFPSRFTPLPAVHSEESDMWEFFQLETDITNEFINWVLSRQGDVVIIEPMDVKMKVVEVCEGILKEYE